MKFCRSISIAVTVLAGCAGPRAALAPAPRPTVPERANAFEAVVVGTIHKAHLAVPGYPLARLAALLESYQPDLVLVEIRPEPFHRGHYEDGPFEMTYVTWLAQKKKVPVRPIDWFRDDDIGRDTAPDESTRPAFEAEAKALESRMKWPLSFEEVHSAEQDAVMLSMLNLHARYLGGNGEWNRRQAWFHHQALQAIRAQGARRVMAFVGAYHRPELEGFLSAQGGAVRNPARLAIPRAGASSRAPQEVIQLWREGLGRLEREAAGASGKLAEALRSKAAYFKLAVDRGGQCCAPESAFRSGSGK